MISEAQLQALRDAFIHFLGYEAALKAHAREAKRLREQAATEEELASEAWSRASREWDEAMAKIEIDGAVPLTKSVSFDQSIIVLPDETIVALGLGTEKVYSPREDEPDHVVAVTGERLPKMRANLARLADPEEVRERVARIR